MASLCACDRRGTPPGAGGPSAQPAPGEGVEKIVESQAGQFPVRPAPPRIEAAWPAGWRVSDSGVTGPPADTLIWFRLEAGAVPVEEAVRAALDALRPLAGELALEDVAASNSRQEAIGQFRGARLSGVIHAVATGRTTAVRVTLDTARETDYLPAAAESAR
jgi:hypothetical protein